MARQSLAAEAGKLPAQILRGDNSCNISFLPASRSLRFDVAVTLLLVGNWKKHIMIIECLILCAAHL